MILSNNEEHSKNKLIIDEAIFIKIYENDMAAFEEFYKLTERSIYAFVLSILKNHDDALDVVQDTFLKIRAAAHLYKPMGKPLAWVFAIARNLSLSCLRTRNKFNNMQTENFENNINFSYIINNEDRLIFKAVFNVLNELEREIIMLHSISGLAHKEIAQILSIPLSTILSKYHRSLKKIKKYILEQELL
ncbi:MAG: RNA polymerase sigma factor [Eubacteriaceae bacterium]|nr:RNA polymerase sigma factor [Eubacteriaceae bacterium]